MDEIFFSAYSFVRSTINSSNGSSTKSEKQSSGVVQEEGTFRPACDVNVAGCGDVSSIVYRIITMSCIFVYFDIFTYLL